MDREDIIRMAQECQFAHYYESGDLVAMPQLERFAALVAAHEREACAKEVQDEIKRVKPVYSVTAENALKAIRARGEKCG